MSAAWRVAGHTLVPGGCSAFAVRLPPDAEAAQQQVTNQARVGGAPRAPPAAAYMLSRMYRNACPDKDGTQQPSYGRRRTVILAAALSLLGLLAWAFSGGGEPARPAPGNSRASGMLPAAANRSTSPPAQADRTGSGQASPAAAPRTAALDPGGPCPPSAVVLSLFSSRPSYLSGQDPQFEVYAVSTASGACTFDLGPGKLHLIVMSAGRVIWDSADCARSGATWVVRLSRGVPAQESVTWNRSITLPGCVKLASSARLGTYEVQARADAVASQVRAFGLR